jgi:hypothetical protein
MNWFNRKKKYKSNNSFDLLIIDDKGDTLQETLGISEERYEDIADICKIMFQKHNKISDVLRYTLKEMNHINEVAYAIMLISRYNEINRNKLDHPLLDFLKDLGKNE